MKVLLFLLLSFNVLAVNDEDINALLKNNDLPNASKLINQINKNDTNFNKVNYYKAIVAFRLKKLDDAEDYLEKALKSYPHAKTFDLAGGIYGRQAQEASVFSKLGYAKKSKKYLLKAHLAEPENINYMEGLIQFNLQAPSIAGGDKDAIEPLLKLMEKQNKTKAISLRVQFLIAEEDEETALKYLDKEIAANPAILSLVFSKGYLYNRLNQNEQAVAEYKKISNIETHNKSNTKAKYDALYQIGRLASIEKKWLEEGRDAFIQFIDHEKIQGTPPKSWANYRLGLIYQLLNEKMLAQNAFKNAMSFEPDDDLIKKLNKEIVK